MVDGLGGVVSVDLDLLSLGFSSSVGGMSGSLGVEEESAFLKSDTAIMTGTLTDS